MFKITLVFAPPPVLVTFRDLLPEVIVIAFFLFFALLLIFVEGFQSIDAS
jgi:hypothetical protein